MKDLDIKIIWKDGDAADEKAYAKPLIDKIIRSGSHSLIHRFIRTLLWEQWVNLITMSGLAGFMAFKEEWAVCTGLFVLNLIFFLYYQNLRGKLKSEPIDSNVLQYLYNVQTMIRRFIRHYKIASLVVCALASIVAYYLNEQNFYDERLDTKPFLIGLIAGLMAALPVTFYLIHILYGKKAKKLEQMICSLEKEEA